MPVKQGSNGKWQIGNGPAMYHSKELADKAYIAYLASKGDKVKKIEKTGKAIIHNTGQWALKSEPINKIDVPRDYTLAGNKKNKPPIDSEPTDFWQRHSPNPGKETGSRRSASLPGQQSVSSQGATNSMHNALKNVKSGMSTKDAVARASVLKDSPTNLKKTKGDNMKKEECTKAETQLKLKDVKGTGLSRKDKKIMDPDNSPKAMATKTYEGGTPLKGIKGGLSSLKDKVFKGEKAAYNKLGQWSLKKSITDAAVESMMKSLFPEEQTIMDKAVTPNEPPKPSKDCIRNDVKWKLECMKELSDLKYVVREEWETKDKAVYNKIKTVLEDKYNQTKNEVVELVDKYKAAKNK